MNMHAIRAASLRVASRERKANFDFLESYLRLTPRYEATVDSLTHNDYLTHGAIRPSLMPEKWPDPGKARRRSYDRMCEHILNFLGATLERQSAARESLEQSIRGKGPEGGFQLRFKPPDPRPPTARQLAQYFRQNRGEKTVELMRSFGGSTGSAIAVADVLLKDGDATAALSLLALVEQDLGQEVGFQIRLGQARALLDDLDGARAAYRKAAELLPEVESTRGPQLLSRSLIQQGLEALGQSETPKGR
jgi:hypothetical protein